jgi:hypothetical protein
LEVGETFSLKRIEKKDYMNKVYRVKNKSCEVGFPFEPGDIVSLCRDTGKLTVNSAEYEDHDITPVDLEQRSMFEKLEYNSEVEYVGTPEYFKDLKNNNIQIFEGAQLKLKQIDSYLGECVIFDDIRKEEFRVPIREIKIK